MKALLRADANLEHTAKSETALTWAVRGAHVAVVEALVRGGSRVGARNGKDLGALHLASIGGAGCDGSSGDCVTILRAILKAVDADCEQAAGTDGLGALHYAASRNNVIATETLLAAGCAMQTSAAGRVGRHSCWPAHTGASMWCWPYSAILV